MTRQEGLTNMLNDVKAIVCKKQCNMNGPTGSDICVFGCPFARLIFKLEDMNKTDALVEFIWGKEEVGK